MGRLGFPDSRLGMLATLNSCGYSLVKLSSVLKTATFRPMYFLQCPVTAAALGTLDQNPRIPQVARVYMRSNGRSSRQLVYEASSTVEVADCLGFGSGPWNLIDSTPPIGVDANLKTPVWVAVGPGLHSPASLSSLTFQGRSLRHHSCSRVGGTLKPIHLWPGISIKLEATTGRERRREGNPPARLI